jgi:DNA segregation ATPase FtsK/SpoIIIE-like protein
MMVEPTTLPVVRIERPDPLAEAMAVNAKLRTALRAAVIEQRPHQAEYGVVAGYRCAACEAAWDSGATERHFPTCALYVQETPEADRPFTEDELTRAREFVKEKPSTSYLQRKLYIGYGRASKMMELFEAEGLISKRNTAGKRTVLANR